MAGIKEIVIKMSPQRPVKSVKALARLHRWEGGGIGVGYSNRNIIKRFGSMRNFLNFSQTNGYRVALIKFDLQPRGITTLPANISIRKLLQRHNHSNTYRFITYNTYLLTVLELDGNFVAKALLMQKSERLVAAILSDDFSDFIDVVEWIFDPIGKALKKMAGEGLLPEQLIEKALSETGLSPIELCKKVLGIDIPNFIRIGGKPQVEIRSFKIGEELKNRFDFCFLCEVFSDRIFTNILNAWDNNTPQFGRPPVQGEKPQSSGLRSIIQKGNITRKEAISFQNRGNIFADSDSWSAKGVMLTEIDVNLGKIEVYSTHLLFGGGGILPGKSTDEERTATKIAQVKEIIAFYNQHHKPENIALIVGDFNIDANANLNRPNGAMGEYNREYLVLRQLMESINMYDSWICDAYDHMPNAGFTNRYTDSEPHDKTFATCIINDNGYCNDNLILKPNKHEIGEGRLDFVFIQKPEEVHKFNIDITIPQRVPFPFHSTEKDAEFFLSDHLGIAFDIIVSTKN